MQKLYRRTYHGTRYYWATIKLQISHTDPVLLEITKESACPGLASVVTPPYPKEHKYKNHIQNHPQKSPSEKKKKINLRDKSNINSKEVDKKDVRPFSLSIIHSGASQVKFQ